MPSSPISHKVQQNLATRYKKEARFRILALLAVIFSLLFLAFLLGSVVMKGWTACEQTAIRLDIDFAEARLNPQGLSATDCETLVHRALRQLFPQATGQEELGQLYKLMSMGAAFALQDLVTDRPSLLGTTSSVWLPAGTEVDMLAKGHSSRQLPASARQLSDRQLAFIDTLQKSGRLQKRFNTAFFHNGDSREPELAGIRGAAMGSVYTMLIILVLSFPIGAATAVYLEEFAPKSKITDLIEININNLAAVPSIIFGLLGLTLFLGLFGLPRSSPLVAGLVLTLMTLPTIIMTSRAAIQTVPQSIYEASLGLGASKIQTIMHHVLPSALPSMMTGSIIGMARALGETAPLIMIGMVAFIADVPHDISDPATTLPVQIYLWADSPGLGFVERASAAILVLLFLLMLINAAAIYVRSKYERRW